jgi:hypothetical protein
MAAKMSIMHFLTEHQSVIEDCQKKESEAWELNLS